MFLGAREPFLRRSARTLAPRNVATYIVIYKHISWKDIKTTWSITKVRGHFDRITTTNGNSRSLVAGSRRILTRRILTGRRTAASHRVLLRRRTLLVLLRRIARLLWRITTLWTRTHELRRRARRGHRRSYGSLTIHGLRGRVHLTGSGLTVHGRARHGAISTAVL